MQTQSFHSQTHLFQGFPLPKRKHKEEFWVSSSTEVPVYAENKIENQILVIPNSLAIACTTHVFTGNNVQKRAQLRGIIQQLITNNRYDCLLELIQKLLGDQAFGTYLNDFYAGNQNANFPTFFIHTRNRLELSELYIYGSGRLGNLEQNLVLHAGAEQQVVWNPFIEDLSHLADSLLDEHESIASTPEIYTTSATHKSFIIGQKRYEISNHLGNVSSVITDRKFGVPLSSTDPTINYYLADIVTATDYDPYGQALPGRVWNRAGYRFGFNGQEFDSELGEIWSAEFCEYDASLGRRWDIDPIDLPWQSPYVAFDCNPIFNSDPKGLMSAPTGDGDGPKTAQKISKKASYTASRASMEQGFKNNKGQYALNIVTSKSNNFNQIHKPNINLVINFTNDKLFDDDSEEILGKASVFYHVDSEWKNQSELKESDLNKINIDTPVEIRVTVTTNIDDEDEDPLIEIIATLFHELYIHASPFSEIAELIKQGGEGQTTKPNTSSVEEIYDPIDRKTLYDYFMMDYIDPNDLDKGSLKNRLKDKNSKGTNTLYVNNQHLGLIQWYFYTKAKSNKPILTIRSAQILNEALINFKDVHPLLYKKVEIALLKDAKTHLLIAINKQLKLCGLTY